MQTTETQLALLIQKVDQIAAGVDDLKPLSALVLELQKDHAHAVENIKQLNTIAEMRGAKQHEIDKRVLILERWHKFMLALPVALLTISLAVGGYAKSFFDSLDDFKNDTRQRVTSLEFILNSPNFEKAMDRDRSVSTGGKD